ncbi:hypothetical protein H5410_056888, partial [Solanum commersonii]
NNNKVFPIFFIFCYKSFLTILRKFLTLRPPTRTPPPLEVENPNSFQFSTPFVEPFPSTLACKVGKMGESETPQPQLLIPSSTNPTESFLVHKLLACVFDDFERLFDGDLLDRRGTESNILAAAKEWVVQNLSTLKGDIQVPFSEGEYKSPDLVLNRSRAAFDQTLEIEAQLDYSQKELEEDDGDIPLSWKRRGIKGTNNYVAFLADTEQVGPNTKVQISEGPSEFEHKSEVS